MIKRTVEYTDYNGNKRVEDLYFNLTQFEATEIAMELPDGVVEELTSDKNGENETVVATHLVEKLGNKGVVEFIKKIVLKSYGHKSEDGRRIVKSPEISEEFSQTPAFSDFMIQLISDDKAASDFINGVIPEALAAQMVARNS